MAVTRSGRGQLLQLYSATTYTLDFGGTRASVVISSCVPAAVLYFPVVWLETEVPMKISTRKGHVIVVFE